MRKYVFAVLYPCLVLIIGLQSHDTNLCEGWGGVGFVVFYLGFIYTSGLVLTAGASVLGAAFWKRYRKHFFSLLKASSLSLCLSVGAWEFNGVSEDWAIERIKENSTEIIAALDSYRVKHKKFPEKIEKLVPAFLSKVPESGVCAQRNYQYHREEDGSFSLLIALDQYVFEYIIYDSRTKKWNINPV